MVDRKGKSKTGKEIKREERLRRLLGVDLCACGGGHRLKCHGICRVAHTNSGTGRVECGEMYHIDYSVVKSGGFRRKNRSSRHNRQEDVGEVNTDKDRRREKFERNR
jgi:hypothetical protein